MKIGNAADGEAICRILHFIKTKIEEKTTQEEILGSESEFCFRDLGRRANWQMERKSRMIKEVKKEMKS